MANISKIKIKNDIHNIKDSSSVVYGTCTTAAGTATKIITLVNADSWYLRTGSIIVIKFSYTNTANNPTFNVKNSGTKGVWYNTSKITTENLSYAGTANRPMQFMYNGTNWVFIGWSYDNNSEINDLDTRLTTLEDKVSNYHETVVYGYHIDPNEADSSAAVTYLADAVGMTPAAMGADSFNYGSWQNAFFMPKPCMLRYDGTVAYYLNPNDYSKKLDGTPSDVANPDFEGNAMMEWGLIWYKFVGGAEDGEGYFYVSNKQIDDSYHCWCNYDANNNIIPHFYTAIYNSTLYNGKFRSLSGVALTKENGSGYTTGAQEITYCTANNTTDIVEWYTDVYSDRILINALLVLMGKSLNTQFVFGKGLDSGSETAKNAYITGSLDNKGLFYGVTANGNSPVKTFGMENWWGCVWHRTAGCISVDRALKIKLTYGTADGSTTVGYNQTGDGYIDNSSIPTENGYVKAMKYNEYGYMTSNASGGSASTYYADYFYQQTGTRYLLVGGSSGDGVSAGAFYFYLGNAPSTLSWHVAAVLSCKPLL